MYAELIKRLRNGCGVCESTACQYYDYGDCKIDKYAADTIEKLAAEVERLHKENFWLSGRTDNA